MFTNSGGSVQDNGEEIDNAQACVFRVISGWPPKDSKYLKIASIFPQRAQFLRLSWSIEHRFQKKLLGNNTAKK